MRNCTIGEAQGPVPFASQGNEPATNEPATAKEPPANQTAGNSAPVETTSQKNAAKMAKDYLSFMAFSRSGLIDQLVYEGFSREQAAYGADGAGL